MTEAKAPRLTLVHSSRDRFTPQRQRSPRNLPAPTPLHEPIDVLVVDDDTVLRRALSEFLEDQGYRVSTAANGEEALKTIERHHPNLVLLDLRMPIMDGWDLARELRARSLDVPLIIMTGAAEAREQARQIGATAYVPKPVSLPALVSKLDRLCA